MCYKILKDKELVTEGKPNEIKGLVAHLIHLEKRDAVVESENEVIDLNVSEELIIDKKTISEELAAIDSSTF